MKEIEVESIKIKFTGNFWETHYSKRFGVKVPVFTIENPEDVPYTKEILTEYVIEEYRRFQTFMGGTSVGQGSITYLVEFDKNVLDLYIPKDLKQEISNCLKSKDFNRVAWRSPENIRVIGEFSGYNQFEIDGENIHWYVDFKAHKLEMVDEEGKFKREIDKSDYDYIFEVLDDDMEFFENKIWSCVQNKLMPHKTFVDFNYMSFYTRVERVNY
jgi:hypothetical protein